MPNLLGAKSTRRIARLADEPTITRAWAGDTGPLYHFVTWDHEHGVYDSRSRTVTIEKDNPHRLDSCYDDGALLIELDPFVDDGRWPTLKD